MYGGLAVFGAEAVEECGIGAELFSAAVKLARVAEIDEAALIDAVNDAAELDVAAAERIKIAGFVTVLGKAGDGEAAVFIAGVWTAGVEEARAIAQLNDVVDVGGDADVLAGVAGGVGGRVANARGGVKCGADQQEPGERSHPSEGTAGAE